MLHQGEQAPEFSLPDADMELFDLASLRGRQHAVLFFYPRDGTPTARWRQPISRITKANSRAMTVSFSASRATIAFPMRTFATSTVCPYDFCQTRKAMSVASSAYPSFAIGTATRSSASYARHSSSTRKA